MMIMCFFGTSIFFLLSPKAYIYIFFKLPWGKFNIQTKNDILIIRFKKSKMQAQYYKKNDSFNLSVLRKLSFEYLFLFKNNTTK